MVQGLLTVSKHRTVSTGLRIDEKGIFIVISVSSERGEDSILISGSEASELIPKLRIHMDEIFTNSKWYSQEDWK